MKPLLVAVDFSELSQRAVAYAVEHARGSGRSIDLLHVGQDTLPARAQAHAPAEIVEAIREAEDKEDRQQLDRVLATIPPELRGHGVLRRGPAAQTICEVAKNGYELVVVSTHGRTGLSQFFIGSVAERVVRFSPIPVLVVR
jgi:nucleotide-binding universal stress UspA family protein